MALHCYKDDHGTDYIYDERDWNTRGSLIEWPYGYAKMMAEKAAWEFLETPENKKFELVTILPAICVGPLHSANSVSESIVLIKDLFVTYPAPPSICFGFVDVRDAALAHILAIEVKNAAGNRYIVNKDTLFLLDVCKLLSPYFPEHNLAKVELPNFFVYIASLMDKRLNYNYLAHTLGFPMHINGHKVERELNLKYSPIEQAFVETVNSLIQFGIIPDKRFRTSFLSSHHLVNRSSSLSESTKKL